MMLNNVINSIKVYNSGPVGFDGKRVKTPLLPNVDLFCVLCKRFLKILSNQFEVILKFFGESSGYNTRQFWLGKLQTPYLTGVTERSSDQYFEKKFFFEKFHRSIS